MPHGKQFADKRTFVCSECGKEKELPYGATVEGWGWAYQTRFRFCSYTCMRRYEKAHIDASNERGKNPESHKALENYRLKAKQATT